MEISAYCKKENVHNVTVAGLKETKIYVQTSWQTKQNLWLIWLHSKWWPSNEIRVHLQRFMIWFHLYVDKDDKNFGFKATEIYLCLKSCKQCNTIQWILTVLFHVLFTSLKLYSHTSQDNPGTTGLWLTYLWWNYHNTQILLNLWPFNITISCAPQHSIRTYGA